MGLRELYPVVVLDYKTLLGVISENLQSNPVSISPSTSQKSDDLRICVK